VDSEEGHPTLGFGKSAYINWKSVNEARRDQTEGRLGQITSSFSQGIRIDVGYSLLMDPDIRAGRSAEEIDLLTTKTDPQFKWVTQVDEAKVLKALDAHFSVMDPGPFLAMKMPTSVNPRTKEGDVNYCAVSHGIFASKWLAALAELIAGGWDQSHTDLRLTYINALASNRTLFDQAQSYKTTSHTLLIAHMRTWTEQKTQQQKSDLETKRRLDVEDPHSATTKPSAAPASGQASGGGGAANSNSQQKAAPPAKFTGEAKALFSKMESELGKLRQEMKAKESLKTKQAPPPRGVDAENEYFCHGCGHTFQKDGRRIPCAYNCVYNEHEEYNRGCMQGVAYPPGKARLEWGTPEEYLKRYKKNMPERAKRYVESRNAQKRKRSASKSGDEA
jgi:hypothetical protein